VKKLIYLIALFLLVVGCSSNNSDQAISSDSKSKSEENTKLNEKLIPGIAAVDVHSNFTKNGFELKKYLNVESPYYICEKQMGKDMMSVTAYGNPSEIRKIEAITTEGNIDFLGYVASLPYEGSSPSEATAWIKNNPEGGKTKFGSVTFDFYKGTNNTKILELYVE
jgi:predicted component of type VI protein secretion system